MTILDDLITGLNKSGFKVGTDWTGKVDEKDIIIDLEDYKIEIETSTTYLNTISFSLNVVSSNVSTILTNVPKVIVISHQALSNYHHVKFTDCKIVNTGNQMGIALIFEYKEVISVV